jgi:glycosyltransferase involved in cell wall biosynthesis
MGAHIESPARPETRYAGPPEPMRILHIFGGMNRGGAEMRTLELMRNLDTRRYRFEFCCLSGLKGELDEEIRFLGGAVHLVRFGLGFAGKFRKLLRSGDFQAVHSNVHWPSGYLLRLAAKEGVPQRICHFRTTWDGKRAQVTRQFRNRVLKHWVELYATDIVAVSEGALTANMGPFWSLDARCRVIYSGIELSRFQIPPDRVGVRAEFGMPQDAVVVVHVGRTDPPKNHERLIRIFHQLANAAPNTYLLLVGARRDPIESRIRGMVEQMKLGDRVVLTGVRADLPRLLRASDLMIFPSLWEGLPGAVLEAVAAGLPVLASELPGTSEIARYLPAVRTLPLERSDEGWAAAAIEIQSCRGRGIQTEEAFLKSPFSMRNAVKSYKQLYSSPGVRRFAVPHSS